MALAEAEVVPTGGVADCPDRILSKRLVGPAWCLVLVGVSLVIGMWHVLDSGPKWPDGPRYANGGAMIHDWILSGELLHPYEFAKRNYTQYPGFSIPYHPPGYPGLLALWFLVVGMSYASARCFVALCLGLAACFFYGILKRLGAERWIAMAGSLLLVTTPEIALWTRSTMSEIPALMFILAGSYCFIAWVNTKRPSWCWAAFALAEMAFLCRVTTVGILPAWFLFLASKKDYRRLYSPHLVVPAAVYFIGNYAWVKFATSFAYYEVLGPVFRKLTWFSTEHLFYYLASLPDMVGWIVLVAACLGLILTVRNMKLRALGWFWVFWLTSYFVFQLLMTVNEQRYFVPALPALCGLAVCPLMIKTSHPLWNWLKLSAAMVVIVVNLVGLRASAYGLVGYRAVSQRLAKLDEPGNILMSCILDQDLIFRFRCRSNGSSRRLIRGDRSLAVRLPEYAGIPPKPMAKTPDDVLEIVRRGRVRYLLTCAPPKSGSDRRPADMVLAHSTALVFRDRFTLLDQFDILCDHGGPNRNEVCLWRFRGELPPGACELPVVIPTANITFQPDPSIGAIPIE